MHWIAFIDFRTFSTFLNSTVFVFHLFSVQPVLHCIVNWLPVIKYFRIVFVSYTLFSTLLCRLCDIGIMDVIS